MEASEAAESQNNDSPVADGIPPPPPPSPPPAPPVSEGQAVQPWPQDEQYLNHHYQGAEPQYAVEQYAQYGAGVDPSQAYAAAYQQQNSYYVSQDQPAVAPLPPAKRQKTDDGGMAVALTKISVHIANPKKFAKASALLRQLFTEGKLSGAHGDLAFECLKAAMRDAGAEARMANRADLRKEYVKLFSVASNNAQIFSAREKLQLDVYGLLAVLLNQIQTDDSFVLNRVLGKVKQSIQHLPEATEEDDAVLRALQDRQRGGERPAEPANSNSGADPGEVGDSTTQSEATWTEQETMCMKRHALICCLQEAKQLHSKQWARTSVEMAFEEACKNLERFCLSQRPVLESLGSFAKNQRTARQQGRLAARDDRRDRTAFETARKEWSKTAGISGRGPLDGGKSDHHSEVWLG